MANENNVIVKVTLVKSTAGRLKNQQATIAALGEMRSPMTVAQNRGISVDKVFNG